MAMVNRRAFLGSMAAAAMAVRNSDGAPIRGGLQVKLQRPVALLVCFNEYANAKGADEQVSRKLLHPATSGAKLAKRLLENNYIVTVVTDKAQFHNVQEVVGEQQLQAFTLKSASDVKELQATIDDWQRDAFQKNGHLTPFGVMAFSGHGVDRDGKLYFQTPGDGVDGVGLSLSDLQKEIGKRPLPIIMVVDTCRTKLNANAPMKVVAGGNQEAVAAPDGVYTPDTSAAPTDKVSVNRGNRLVGLGTKGDVRDAHANHGVLTIYASQEGREAVDSDSDLLSLLAEGLDPVQAPLSFVARRACQMVDFGVTAPESQQDLTAMAWFNYALTRLPNHTSNLQTGQVSTGFLDQSMIVATRRKSYVYSRPPMSLVEGWGGFAGKMVAKASPFGISFERIPMLMDYSQEFAVGFLDMPGIFQRPIDPVGKVLIVELLAECEDCPPNSSVICTLGPGNNAVPVGQDGSVIGNQFYPGWKDSIPLPIGTRWVVALPLAWARPGHEFKTMCIAPSVNERNRWPSNAKITVTRMTLVDGRGAPSLPPIRKEVLFPPINLLSRWWFSDVIDPAPPAGRARVTATTALNSRDELTLSLKRHPSTAGTMIGKGGPIYPPIFVDSRQYELYVNVQSIAPVAGGAEVLGVIEIDIRGQNRQLLSTSVTIDASMVDRTILLQLNLSGFVDYLAISTDSHELQLNHFELVPKGSVRGAAGPRLPKKKSKASK